MQGFLKGKGEKVDGSKGVVLASEQNAPRSVTFSSFWQPELRGLPARANIINAADLVRPHAAPTPIANPFVATPPSYREGLLKGIRDLEAAQMAIRSQVPAPPLLLLSPGAIARETLRRIGQTLTLRAPYRFTSPTPAPLYRPDEFSTLAQEGAEYKEWLKSREAELEVLARQPSPHLNRKRLAGAEDNRRQRGGAVDRDNRRRG